MSLKAGKDSQIKSKDQVRHHYYRIWSTVNKLYQASWFPPKLTDDKTGQELYAMMAYGEFRRKLRTEPTKKMLEMKFEELIRTQQTCIKHKGRTIKVRIAIPDLGKKSAASNINSATLNERIKVYLHPADNYSLRCVQSVAACPSLLVNMSIDGTLSQIREMISIKWKTTMERLELKSNAKNNLVKIDEIQRHKGKLIVHWTSTKLDEPGQPLGDEDPSLLTCYLANDQPEKFVISYRFKRNRPLCEPVQLLAKCASYFTEIINDVDKMDYLPPPQPPPLPDPPDNNGVRSLSGSPKKDQPKKFSEEEVNRHLMELNGLTRKTQTQRRVLDRGHSSSSSSSSSHISQSPTTLSSQSEVAAAHLSTNTHQQHHEESNSSISHILSSVLNDSHCPTQLEGHDLEMQINLLMNENSLDYERLTKFSELMSDDTLTDEL